jgi:hypothetical protein
MYINTKNIMGMPVIGHHVWDRAYGHDTISRSASILFEIIWSYGVQTL